MGTQAQPASEKPSPCFARQPILAADESVIGYELLIRDNADERHFTADADSAIRAAIDTLNLIGLSVLCDGKPAFINCTHSMLLMDYFSLLPPQEVVIELQERVPADEKVRSTCETLKKAGYAIALDLFAPGICAFRWLSMRTTSKSISTSFRSNTARHWRHAMPANSAACWRSRWKPAGFGECQA